MTQLNCKTKTAQTQFVTICHVACLGIHLCATWFLQNANGPQLFQSPSQAEVSRTFTNIIKGILSSTGTSPPQKNSAFYFFVQGGMQSKELVQQLIVAQNSGRHGHHPIHGKGFPALQLVEGIPDRAVVLRQPVHVCQLCLSIHALKKTNYVSESASEPCQQALPDPPRSFRSFFNFSAATCWATNKHASTRQMQGRAPAGLQMSSQI